MNKFTRIASVLFLLTQAQGAIAQTRYSGNVQASLTSGDNNGTSETYKGLWLSGKAEKGLSRHSLISFKAKVGGRNYNDSNSNLSIIELEGNYLYQPSAGYFSPTYTTTLKTSSEDLNSTSKARKKTSIAIGRYQPLSNKIALNLSLKQENKTGNIKADTTSFNINFDYISSIKTTFYVNYNYANESSTTDLTASAPTSSSSLAARDEIASSHLPGEPGYNGPAVSGSSLQADSNISSLSFGAVYAIDSKQFIDLGYIKHLYEHSSSNYIAIDYFYKF